MNKGSFRLVFNRRRGMLVAVEESATSTGKGHQGGARSIRRARQGPARIASLAAALPSVPFALLTLLALAAPASARIVANPDAGANRPDVIQTSNGLPQVNITRPSGAGVSTNAYTQFDVGRGGAILNNSPTIVSTRQAGFVNGNPNLLPGQNARIIVNQVTSALPSQLRGYLEVAGGRAEVVVANPNGILVDGGGFINTSRATLTTGVPVFGGTGSLDAFRVTGGQISVQGAGLNAANVDQVDLIARTVTANAALYANNLNVIAGAGQVDRATLAATPIAGAGPAAGVGIDVSQLGGMYASKILLVGTEAGVGVSNRGVLAAQAGDLTLSAQGRLELAGKTSASGNLAIAARGGVDNIGTTYGAQAVSLDTAGALSNSGTLAAQQALRVNAGSVASSGRLGAGVNADGSVGQRADLTVIADGTLSSSGKHVAGGNASLNGTALQLAGSQTTALGNLNLSATAGDINLNGAAASAGGALGATARGALSNDRGQLYSQGATAITAGSVSNQGGQMLAQGATTVYSAGAINNALGEIQAGGALGVKASSLDNGAGRLVSLNADGLSVAATGALTNTAGTTANGAKGGVIGGNGSVRLKAGTLANQGEINAQANAGLDARSLDNDRGSITAGDALTATVAGAASNRQGTMSAGTLDVTAGSLDNGAGHIEGGRVGIRTAGDLANRGGAISQFGEGDTVINAGGAFDNTSGTLATSGKNLTLDAQSLSNDSGRVAHAGNGTLALTSHGALGNAAGILQTNGALDVQAAGAVTNTGGRIEAAGTHGALSLAARSVDNTGGRVVNVGDGLTRVRARQALVNANAGLIGGNGKVQLVAGALANHGQITAKGDASLDAQSLDNDQGRVTAGTALTATVAGVASNRQGTLSGGVVDLSVASLDNGMGLVEGGQVGIRTTGGLSNRGGAINQFGKADTVINAGGAFDNTSGTLATNGKNLTVDAQSLANDGGRIAHAGGGALALTSRGALGNTAGAILSNGTLAVQAASLDNTRGNLSAQGAARVATGAVLINRQGTLYGQSGLSLTSQGQVDNTNGTAQTGGDLLLAADGTLSNAGGTLTANGAHGKATVSASGIDNRGGRIANAGDGATTVTATGSLDNTGGTLGGNGDVSLAASDLDNTGGAQIAAAGALTLGITRSVDNRGGRIYGGKGLSLDQAGATLANDSGTVLGGADVQMKVASMTNQGGAVRANQDIGVSSAGGTVSGSGEMTAGRNLTLSVAGDYLNDAANKLSADGDMQINAGGTLTNTGTLAARGSLAVQGANVNNAAGAGINAQSTTVRADNAINNAGRIEGHAVNTLSGTLANTGAVIGNTVQVQASDISNTGPAAVIAAARDLRIHASNAVSNLDGALIYSAGNLQIARDGTRDPGTGMLANQINVLNNRSAAIEADGDIDIAARAVNNTRTSIVTEAGTPQQTAARTLTTWFAGFTGTEQRNHKSITFPSWNWAGASAPVSASLINALRSPITVEVPKTTVASFDPNTKTLSFTQAPVEAYFNPQQPGCANDNDCFTPPPILTRPITTSSTQYYQDIQDTGTTYKITFWPDWDPARHIRPDQVRVRYDLGPDYHDYSEISRTTVATTATDRLVSATPAARIQAQGTIRVNSDGGTILNQSSIMAAGGSLIRRAVASEVQDIGTVLQQTVSTTDTSTFYWHRKNGSNSDTQEVPYPTTPQNPTTVAALPALATANQSVQTTAQDITVGSVNRVGQTVTGSGVAGGGASGTLPGSVAGTAGAAPTLGAGAVAAATGATSRPQTLGTAAGGIPNLTLPVNGLFTLRPAPATPYLIETDSRFTQYKTFLSSDYMLGALGLDPQKVQKRLGDGFHEEKLVRDQVTALTGRTFLAGYSDQLQEYQALMNSGVTWARSFGLSPGIGLSDDQMRQLTTDMVWLVAQDVTLPDGTHQSVLVPKLYLAQSSAVDLNRTGALVTGNSVALNASGNVNNSGRIVGDVATQVLGNDIVNRGTIGDTSGTTVVQALQDVRNLGGRIGGQDVLVQAGRDVVSETQTISEVRTIGPNGYRAGATGVGSVAAISATGNAVVLAGRDVTLSGAVLEAGKGALIGAGRDLTVGAVTLGTTQDAVSRGGQSYSHDQASTVAGSLVQAGGNVVAVAGRDATLANAGIQAGGNASLVAGRDLTVTAAKDTHTHSEGSLGGKGAAYTQASTDETVRGSTVQAGNNVTLAAGQAPLAGAVLQANGIKAEAPATGAGGSGGNLAILGSTVATGANGNGGGTASLVAAGDITVGTVTQTHTQENWQEHKRSGFLSSEQSTSKRSAGQTYAVGSTVSADAVGGRAGRDLTVSGSNIVASDDLALRADRNLTIGVGQDTTTSSSAEEKRKSGMFSGGGLSVTIGKQQLNQAQQVSTATNVGSMVGSLNGNASLSAGQAYTQTGSTVSALQGDVGVRAKRVDINAATDTASSSQESHFRQSGLTVTVTNPVLAAAQTAGQMARAQSQTDDPRLKALAGAAAGLAVSNAADAVKADPKAMGGLNISVSLGGSKSDSQQTQSSTTAAGSTVRAGGDVRIRAEGGGTDSNINVVGSNIQAGNNALLKADNQVNLQAAASTAEQHGSNSSGSGGIGIGLNLGAQGASIGLTASASAARGNADGNDVTWTNSHVNAGNTLVIDSGGDTSLRGATATGKQVIADIGGNLNIESLQDTSRYKSKDRSIGGSLTVGAGFAASANVGQQKIDSDYASVTEQSGIRAGAGGYQIDVKGNTDLKGAVIAGGTADKNSLSTDTLTGSDIRNHAEYSASSVSLGGGYAQGKPMMPLGGGSGGGGGVGLTQGGQAATGEAVPGTNLPTSGGNGQGASFAPPIAMSASGSASSTTASGVSAGNITIRNEEKQKALTGKDAAETIASLNRETDNTANALKPIFNEKEIRAGFEIVGALQREAGVFLNNRANEADAAKKAAEAVAKDPSATPEQRAEAQRRADDAAKWGQGGTYRQVMTALTAAAGGNVTGSAAQFAQGAAVGYIQGLAAGQVKAMADSLGKGTPEAESARAALHAIVGCAGAAAASQACGAGAMGAAASSVLGSLLAPTDEMSAQEKQARENLVQSLVAGVAGASGVNATTATNAATFEVENNQLAAPAPMPPMWTPGQAQTPFKTPGKPADKSEPKLTGTPDQSEKTTTKPLVNPITNVVAEIISLPANVVHGLGLIFNIGGSGSPQSTGANTAGTGESASAVNGIKQGGTVELFTDASGPKVPGAVGVGPTDATAVAVDARSMPNIPSNSQATVVASNPYIPKGAGGTFSMMDYLPEATRITQPGGEIVINGTAANKYLTNMPTQAQLDALGLEVRYQGPLLPEYQGQTFLRADGSKLNDSMQSIIFVKKK